MLSAFAHPDFRYLLAGTMGSQMRDWIQTIGQGWLIYQLTGSSAQLGIFSFVRGMAVLLITPLGALLMGVMIDRWNAPNVIFGWCAVATCSSC